MWLWKVPANGGIHGAIPEGLDFVLEEVDASSCVLYDKSMPMMQSSVTIKVMVVCAWTIRLCYRVCERCESIVLDHAHQYPRLDCQKVNSKRAYQPA